jgi:hypothetical protein
MGLDKVHRKQSVTQTALPGFVLRTESIDDQIFAWSEIQREEALQGVGSALPEELL